MRSAAVYSCKPASDIVVKDALIYDQLETALTALADVARHVVPESSSSRSTMPGFGHVRAQEALIAFGSDAHVFLADFQKRTLVTGDLDLERSDLGRSELERADLERSDLERPDLERSYGSRLDGDIEQLIWSCSNTMGIVALGAAAWNSIQLLPIMDRRFHHVPPLRLRIHAAPRSNVLVIDHETEASAGRALVDALARLDADVVYCGGTTLAPLPGSVCWSDDSLIHVHVGAHTFDCEELRLIDSWRSERLTLQLVSDGRGRSWKDDGVLAIENEVNGIICASPEEVVAACQELLDDRVLRQKLIAAGQATIGPLMKTWGAVAADLLA